MPLCSLLYRNLYSPTSNNLYKNFGMNSSNCQNTRNHTHFLLYPLHE